MHRVSCLFVAVLMLSITGTKSASAQALPWNPNGGGTTFSGAGTGLTGLYYDIPGIVPQAEETTAPAAPAPPPEVAPPQDQPPQGPSLAVESWFARKILEDRVFRERILRDADSEENMRNGIMYADVFYHDWDAWGVQGNTFGINPSVTFGDRAEWSLIVPVYVVDADYSEDTLFSVGADGSLRLNFLEDMLSIGAHAYYLILTPQDDAFKDETSLDMIGGGPFASLHLDLGEAVNVSLGVLYEFTEPEDGDTIEELAPGASITARLSDTTTAEIYSVMYMDQDQDSAADDTYLDVGANVHIGSESWSIIIGGRTTTGHDDVDSVEGYLGTEYRF